MSLNVVLSICYTDGDGRTVELTITEDDSVFYKDGKGGQAELSVSRRDINDFLWEIEGFTENWERSYGHGSFTEPGGWLVILESDRQLNKYQGCCEFPPDWEAFLALFNAFISP